MRLLSQLRLGRRRSRSLSLSQFLSRMLVTRRLRGGGEWNGDGPRTAAVEDGLCSGSVPAGMAPMRADAG